MADTWIAIGVVLLAVMTGFLIPVLAQLLLTLRSLRRTLDRLAPRVDSTLVEVQRATERVIRLGTTLNRGSERAVAMIEETDELMKAARSLRRAIRVATVVGNAVGPAIAAAIEAFHYSREATEDPGEHDGEHGPPQPEASGEAGVESQGESA